MKNKYFIGVLIVIIIGLSAWIYLHPCDCQDSSIDTSKEIKHIDTAIHKYERGIEVRQSKDKAKAGKIKDREKTDTVKVTLAFDSTATKNTIYTELVKCDSIGIERLETITELSELVIDKDSTISDQSIIIAQQEKRAEGIESDRKQERKEARKAKRKAFVRGLASGAVIVATAVIVIILL